MEQQQILPYCYSEQYITFKNGCPKCNKKFQSNAQFLSHCLAKKKYRGVEPCQVNPALLINQHYCCSICYQGFDCIDEIQKHYSGVHKIYSNHQGFSPDQVLNQTFQKYVEQFPYFMGGDITQLSHGQLVVALRHCVDDFYEIHELLMKVNEKLPENQREYFFQQEMEKENQQNIEKLFQNMKIQ